MKLIREIEKAVRKHCGRGNEKMAAAIISDVKTLLGAKAENATAIAKSRRASAPDVHVGHDRGLLSPGPYAGSRRRLRVERASSTVEDTSANGEPQTWRHQPDR